MYSKEEKVIFLEFCAKREYEKSRITGDPFMAAEHQRYADILSEAAEDLKAQITDNA